MTWKEKKREASNCWKDKLEGKVEGDGKSEEFAIIRIRISEVELSIAKVKYCSDIRI